MIKNIRFLTPWRSDGYSLAPRKFHSTTVYNGLIWSFGGQSAPPISGQGEWYSDVITIDPLTGHAVVKSGLNVGIAHTNNVVFQDTAYIVGGNYWNGSKTSASPYIQRVDFTQNTTTIAHTNPIGVYDSGMIKYNDTTAFSLGGWRITYNTAQAYRLNVNGQQLTVDNFNLAISRSYGLPHRVNDTANSPIILVAGYHRPDASVSRTVREIEVIDPLTLTTSIEGSLTLGRRNCCTRKVGDSIYMAGGIHEDGLGRLRATGSIERINLSNFSSELVGWLIHPVYHAQSVIVTTSTNQQYMVLIGGQTANQVLNTTIQSFNLLTGESDVLTLDDRFTLDHDVITTIINNKLYIFGGETYNYMNTNQLIEIDFGDDVTLTRD